MAKKIFIVYIIGLNALLLVRCGNTTAPKPVLVQKLAHVESCAKIPYRPVAVAAKLNTAGAASGEKNEMAWIEGGRFIMGSDEFEDALPKHTKRAGLLFIIGMNY